MNRNLFAFLLCAAAIPGPAQAGSQPLETIRVAARDFVAGRLDALDGRVVVEPHGLDSRLRLHRCDAALEAFRSSGTIGPGSVTVGVRCPGTRPWSLYVPVRVKVIRPVAVLTRAMSRGEIVGRDDFVLEDQDTAALRAGFIADPAALVGMRLRHSLPAGGVVSRRHVDRPDVVRRGERVMLVTGSARFSVQMHGKALADGAPGERIRVENLSSSRVVEGRVTKDGKVRIQL